MSANNDETLSYLLSVLYYSQNQKILSMNEM